MRDERLAVDFAGIRFPSPIGVGAIATFMGSSIPDEDVARMLLKSAEAGAGYISAGALCHLPKEYVQKRKKRFHRRNGEKLYGNISVADLSDDG